ncbi:hypothetical protein F8388_022579 [Cannabis sativa]|uniref:Zinc knuckle CX2CX4HX4C domain-containing protein n=1 Tax=Cannabis sativa TaxID=3483 RepID=A0A7J6FZD5_CANSA|nr:hypothetical protein F8388_022579 [Cannabis sativa]
MCLITVSRLGLNVEDRDWALHNAPWLFRGYTFALHAWVPGIEGSSSVNVVRIWVQFHNLPHEYFSVANGNLLGGRIGEVIQVEIDEEKPATWGKRWIQFKYEKIDIFCYNCGRLVHQRRGCSLSSPVTVENVDGSMHPLFGPWLSTASRFHDVFSGDKAQAGLSARGGSSIVALNGGESWVPKALEDGRAPKLARNGNKAEIHLNETRKISVNFPSSAAVTQEMEVINPLVIDGVCPGVGSVAVGSNKDLNVLGRVSVGPRRIENVSSGPGVNLEKRFSGSLEVYDVNLNEETVGDNGLCAGPSSNGPRLGDNGGPTLFISNDVASNPNGINELGGNGKPRDKGCSSLVIYNGVNTQKGIGQADKPTSLVPSIEPEVVCGAKVLSYEEKALTKFFHAQEKLLYDLKNFGELDLYEIRKIGGDIGVPASSEINERTTPFKKRKFEASASLCSRPYKIHRKHPDVVRDFPWDTNQRDNDSRMVSDEPSEESSGSWHGI